MQLICPHCNAKLEIAAEHAGASINCPECGGKSQAPVPTAGQAGGALSPEVQAFASKKIAAGVCGILIGALGVHKFVLGLTLPGVIMLLVSVLSCGFGAAPMGIVGLVEGIIYLTKSDEDFYRDYAINEKGWF